MLKVILIICSAIIVTIADSLIKKISISHIEWGTSKTTLYWALVASLYSLQCYTAFLMFKKGADLGIYSCLFVIFYAILSCISGSIFFEEIITYKQYIGMLLAVIGAILLTL